MDALRSIVFVFFRVNFFFSSSSSSLFSLSVRLSGMTGKGEDWKKSMEMDYIMKEREVDEF